jgi:hypothetical protein
MLHAGFAAADITPAPGMDMPGGFARKPGKGVRDKCWAVAAVITDGKTPVALVGTDTLVIAKITVDEARRRIAQATDIPAGNVLIGASHTHSGGPAGAGPGRHEDVIYLETLATQITAAVVAARKNAKPAELGIGSGREGTISYNRRFLMKDGREITHPGKPGTPNHGRLVAPAGPIDPEVGVLAAFDEKGKVAGIVVNFSCHSTVVGGDLFSPDYAGYLRKHLKARYGPEVEVVFLLGACGDVTQVDNQAVGRESGPEHAEMMGMKLAAEVGRAIGRMARAREAPVAVAVETPILTIRGEPDVDRERPAFGLGGGPGAEEVYLAGRKIVADQRDKQPKVATEVMAVRIGPLGIVTNGSEYFTDFALRMKKCSPFTSTWLVELANDALGYIPTADAFVAGGYESRTGRSSKWSMEAGQVLLEAGLKALNRVAPPAGG